jgi:hypothetical protein
MYTSPQERESTSSNNPTWMYSPQTRSNNSQSGGSPEPIGQKHPFLSETDPLLRSSSAGGSSSLLRRDFRGAPEVRRKCTDSIFLFIFGAYWIGMFVIGIYAFTRENSWNYARLVTHGIDFQGKTCGEEKFVYFPDFDTNPDFGFCLDTCPKQDGEELTVQLPVLAKDGKNQTIETVHFRSYASLPWTSICAPAGSVGSESKMIARLQDTIGRFVGALGESWQVLLISCTISFVTSFVYLFFLKYCGCFILSLSICGIQTILVYGSYCLLLASTNPTTYANDPAMKNSLQIATVVVSCSSILFFLLAVYMIRRLFLAGTFIKHATKVLLQLKKLIVVPFICSSLLFLVFLWGILVTLCLFGAGEKIERIATINSERPTVIKVRTESFQVNTQLRWFFLYHLWGMYWTITFVLSIGEMITATSVSKWYFSLDNKVTNLKILQESDPVGNAIQSTFQFHLGTLAFSSATVTIVQYFRSFFLYLQDKHELGDGNFVTEFLSNCCCVSYCTVITHSYSDYLYVLMIQNKVLYVVF